MTHLIRQFSMVAVVAAGTLFAGAEVRAAVIFADNFNGYSDVTYPNGTQLPSGAGNFTGSAGIEWINDAGANATNEADLQGTVDDRFLNIPRIAGTGAIVYAIPDFTAVPVYTEATVSFDFFLSAGGSGTHNGLYFEIDQSATLGAPGQSAALIAFGEANATTGQLKTNIGAGGYVAGATFSMNEWHSADVVFNFVDNTLDVFLNDDLVLDDFDFNGDNPSASTFNQVLFIAGQPLANGSFDNIQIEAVPEPASMVLAGLGVLGVGLAVAHRRKELRTN